MQSSQRPTVFAKALPRVLIVDDDEHVRRLLERLLRSQGCAVVSVESARAALALCVSGARIDVVLVDLVLPDGDGLSLIGAIGAQLGERAPRFIIVSGLATDRDRIPEGVFAVLSKPFAIEHLWSLVRRAARRDLAIARG